MMDTLLTIKGCLTFEQYAVLIMREVKNMTFGNIGDHIGKSDQRARQIHAKAIVTLRRKFKR
jgi:DNA-directed RNA polymerase sigma subunit (sigma70/sigma32)